jgi:cation:H+ antiporter
MTTSEPGSVQGTEWWRHLVAAAGCAVVGVATHFASPFLPVQLVTVGLGIGLISAAIMLAWAADAGEAVFSGGLVLTVVALATVLPEFIIEIRFAFIQQAQLVTANLTGATRLLLTGATALPLLVAFLARRRRRLLEPLPGTAQHGTELEALLAGAAAPPVLVGLPRKRAGMTGPLRLAANRRLELGILLVTSIFAVQIVVRGNLTVFDGIILLALYVLYTRRVQGTPDEEPAVVGVSAGLLSLRQRYRRPAIAALIVSASAAIVTIANPFADALLATGASLGFDPYVLIQSVVPVATEAPEFIVVAVLVANHRPAQGLALFLASSVSQWTLGLGALPIAYLAGGGGVSLPLAGREQLELSLTLAVTLFVVGVFATLRPERVDAFLLSGIFVTQFVYPAPFVRFAAAFVLLVFAIDLLCSRRHFVRPLLRAALGRRSLSGSRST